MVVAAVGDCGRRLVSESMNKLNVKPFIVGAGIVVVALILQQVLPAVLPPSAGQTAWFLCTFLAILIGFVFFGIVLPVKLLSGRVPRGLYGLVEAVIVAGILLGVFGMFQPWLLELYTNGFYVLGISLLCFMIWSHITPKTARQEKEEAQARATAHREGNWA